MAVGGQILGEGAGGELERRRGGGPRRQPINPGEVGLRDRRAALDTSHARSGTGPDRDPAGRSHRPGIDDEGVVAAAPLERVGAAPRAERDGAEGERRSVEAVDAHAAAEIGPLDANERVLLRTDLEQTVGEREVGVALFDHGVGAAAATDRVEAQAAGEEVGTGAPHERVFARGSVEPDRAAEGGGIDNVPRFTPRERRQFDGHKRFHAAGDHEGRVAKRHVGVARLDHHVGPVAAVERVALAAAAGEKVVAHLAVQTIAARPAAAEDVVAAPAPERDRSAREGRCVEEVVGITADEPGRLDVGERVDPGRAGRGGGDGDAAAHERAGGDQRGDRPAGERAGEGHAPAAGDRRHDDVGGADRVEGGQCIADVGGGGGRGYRPCRLAAVAEREGAASHRAGERDPLDGARSLSHVERGITEHESARSDFDDGIGPRAAVEAVDARPAGERIVAATAAERVVAPTARQFDRPEREGACIEDVGPVTADEAGPGKSAE